MADTLGRRADPRRPWPLLIRLFPPDQRPFEIQKATDRGLARRVGPILDRLRRSGQIVLLPDSKESDGDGARGRRVDGAFQVSLVSMD